MFKKKGSQFKDLKEEDVLKVCKAVDADNDGMLSPAEFKNAMTKLGFADFQETAVGVFADFDLGIVRSIDGRKRFSRKRTARCTDVGCCCWFLLFWVGMIVIAVGAFQNGDPSKLMFGKDYEGATCGKGKHKDRPLTYYPRLEYDVMNFAKWAMVDPDFADPSKFQTPGKCVSSCPKEGENFHMDGQKYYVNFNSYVLMGRCLPDYPISPHYFVQCRRFPLRNATTVDDLVSGNCVQYMNTWGEYFGGNIQQNCSAIQQFRSVTCLTLDFPCATFEDPINYQPKYCCKLALHAVYPMCVDYITGKGEYDASPMMQNPVFKRLIDAAGTFARWIGDATRSITYIFCCGVVLTLVQALAWSIAIRHFSKLMVNITVTFAIVLPTVLAIFLYYKAGILHKTYAQYEVYGGISADATTIDDPSVALSENDKKIYLFSAIGVNIIALAMFIVVVMNKRGLRQAAGVISEACKALATLPTVMAWPLLPVLLQVLVIMYWAVVLVYMSTTSTTELTQKHAASFKLLDGVSNKTFSMMNDNFHLPGTLISIPSFDNSSTFGDPNSTLAAFAGGFEVDNYFNGSSFAAPNMTTVAGHFVTGVYWYHGFGLLWTCAFIQGMWYCGLSGAICHWYWRTKHHGKRTEKVKRSGTVKESTKGSKFERSSVVIPHTVYRALRYHAGSVAKGSSLIAFVQLLRVFYEFFIRRFKMVTRNKKMATIRYYINAIRVALLAAQEVMEAVSSQAYIMVVMTGAPFKVAGKAGRALTGQHMITIVFVDSLANMVLRLAKVCMVAASTLTMFLLLETDVAMPTLGLIGAQRPRITSPTFPLFLVAYLSYVVASSYTDIFSATIKTMILSYATDLELNGQLGNYVMSKDFQNFMGCAAAEYKAAMALDSGDVMEENPVDLDSEEASQANLSAAKVAKKQMDTQGKKLVI